MGSEKRKRDRWIAVKERAEERNGKGMVKRKDQQVEEKLSEEFVVNEKEVGGLLIG